MTGPTMSGPEHAREARRLLVHTDWSVRDRYESGAEVARQQLAEAQVHATLALLAAVVQSGHPLPVWTNLIQEWQDGGDTEAVTR